MGKKDAAQSLLAEFIHIDQPADGSSIPSTQIGCHGTIAPNFRWFKVCLFTDAACTNAASLVETGQSTTNDFTIFSFTWLSGHPVDGKTYFMRAQSFEDNAFTAALTSHRISVTIKLSHEAITRAIAQAIQTLTCVNEKLIRMRSKRKKRKRRIKR